MTTVRFARLSILTVLTLASLFLSVATTHAQPEPPRTREALKQAIDLYKARDYEKAAQFFAYAQMGEKSLPPAEQKDLAEFSLQNDIALKGRQDGVAQLRLAEDALKQGRTQDLGNLLKSLNSNQYLSPAERQQLSELTSKAQAQPALAAPAPKADAKALLTAGRAALQAGDLATAESLANQADKARSLLPSWPWGDNPDKLKRDIQTAKAKASQPPTPAVADTMPKNPQLAANEPKASTSSSFMGISLWPFGGSQTPAPKKDDSDGDRRVNEMIARKMVADAFSCIDSDPGKAHFIAMKAKELNVAWGPSEQTPDMVLHELQRRKGATAKPTDLPPATTKNETKPETKTEMPASTDPRVLLKQGRALLAQKKHEEADKVCSQALALNGRWGLFEDTPEKLRKDITRARQAWERDESVRLMVDARKLFTAGDIDEAEKKAYLAQKYHGPYGVFEFGDRPQKLLEECQRAKQARGPSNPSNPSDNAITPKDTNIAKNLPPFDVRVPSIQNADKNRAIVMVREARELERKNMLLEARQTALEARAYKAAFAPDEDSPDNVLLTLAAKCDRQIVAHLQQAVQHAGTVEDTQRFAKAQEQILAAKKLAFAFQLDTGRIDQTDRQIALVAQGQPVNTLGSALPPPRPLPSTGDPQKDQMRLKALERLQQARVELSFGKTAQARKMAQDLYRPEFGVQEEVLALLRSISAEETNQQLLEAKRSFDAGRDAFVRKDYPMARGIFEKIDPRMLPEGYQARLRDFMSTKEMQNIVLTGYIPGTPITPKTNPDDPMNPAPEPSLLDKTRAEEMVRYQAMRQRGQEALRTASDQYKNDQKDEAMETLNRYLEQVNMEAFDKQKTAELRRLPEARIQQFRAMLADATLKNIQSNPFTSNWNEPKRAREIKARQTEAQEHMKIADELYRQRKWNEAEIEAKKVRDIDPENLAATAILRMIDVSREQEIVNRGIDNKELQFKRLLDDDPGQVPSTVDKPLVFNKNYAGKNKNGGEIRHDLRDPKEKAIEYRLRQPISFSFKDEPLERAIETLSLSSGVPIMVDRKALRDARINLESPLTFSAPNIDMKSALNLMLRDLDLSYTIENQVLLITTPQNTIGRLVRVTYPIADLIVTVPDHPLPDVLNYVKMLEYSMRPTNFYPAVGGYNGGSPFGNIGEPISSHSNGLGGAYASKNQGQAGSQGGSAPKDRSKDAMAEVLKQLLQDTVAKNTWESMGGTGNIQYFPMGMALVINQTQEVQEEVQLLLATLRKLQDLQVSVELRAVVVSETFFERIGVDFNMNINAPKLGGTQALLAGDLATAETKGAVSGLNAAGTLTPNLGFPINNSSFNFTTPAFGGYQPAAGLSLGLAFLSDIQVFMFLEAVQGDRRAHVMQAPKLTVFNGQQATIGGLVNRPIVTSLQPVQLGDGNVTMAPVFTNLPQGLTMQVQPVVSPDRRFIRLNVTPTLTGIVDTAGAQLLVSPGLANNPPLPNGQLSVSISNLQSTSLQIANTTVTVPDGGTVLLGGFKFLAEERTEYGPPVLSKIPYLSRLFRNVGWSRDGATLIYLVTARIIMVEEEERIFLGELQPIPR
jgi:type II secretory pathway component GspD/PulD (secretin)